MEGLYSNSSSGLNVDDDGPASDDKSSRRPLRDLEPGCRKSSFTGLTKCGSYVRVSVGCQSKSEIRELKRKLIDELHQVKSLLKRVEAKEVEISSCADGYTNSQFSANHTDGRLMRAHSEVGSVGPPVSHPRPRATVSVADSNNGGVGSEFVDKRISKANSLHRSSEPTAGKNKIPSVDSNKKLKKSNGGINDHRGPGFGADKQSSELFACCGKLLTRLMKHKFGWVFHKPVDVEGLKLYDYFEIVKHPMDLGTVRTRLNKNWYKSPGEFAEDVRLTFRNSMLYNPKGQDVHHMADSLLKMFEENWKTLEKDHHLEFKRYTMVEQTPISGKGRTRKPAPPVPPSPGPPERGLEQSEVMALPVESVVNPASLGHAGRSTVQKKPKLKDSPKREMTYEEKQNLSDDLQNLPSEKLENVVQIIKKRNPQLFLQEDEIEVDIDSVDLDTLWELNQFVANHKKSLSKVKSKAEAGHGLPESILAAGTAEKLKENERGPFASYHDMVEMQRGNMRRSNNSGGGSSSSGSGSSSSDPNSDDSSS